jgi:hypothetical protein
MAPTDLPKDLRYRKFDFFPEHLEARIDMNDPPKAATTGLGGGCRWSPAVQTFAADVAATFWVFLDNGDPDRVHHKVLFELNLRLSPGAFLGEPKPAECKPAKGPVSATLNGLYQAGFTLDLAPDLAVDRIVWSQSAPKTVNQEHTRTESTSNTLSFTVGYKTGSATRSYTWQHGDSFVISDWNIVEQGIGNRMRWEAWQRLPWDARRGAENIDRTKVPDLSRSTLQFFAQGLWTTRERLRETVPFNLTLRHQPQGIMVLPKVAIPTTFDVGYQTHFDVDFRKVK